MISESLNPKRMNPDVWYLAHPVAADAQFTTEQNLDHTVKIAEILFSAGFKVVAPWHLHCLFLRETPENREICLEVDCFLVEKIGRMILTGHKLSAGMLREHSTLFKTSSDYPDGREPRLLNFVGYKDSDLKRIAESWVQQLEELWQ
jgi:hypothetical protein